MIRIGRILSLVFAAIIVFVYVGTLFQKDETTTQELLGFFQFLIFPWLYLILLALTAYALGAFIIKLFDRPIPKSKQSRSRLGLSNIENILYSLGIGFSFLSILVWGLGWLGLLYKPLLVLLIAIILLVFRSEIPVLYRRLKEIGGQALALRGFDLILTLLLLLWIACTMFVACNPSIGGDPLSSHLYSPKVYLENHSIVYYTWFQFLQLHSMLALLQMVFFKDPGSLLPYFYMLMTASAIYLIGRLWFNRTAGLIGALLYVILPMSHIVAMQNLVEHTLAFYIVLAFHGLLKYKSTNNETWLSLAGMSAGSACAVDINGLIPAFAIIVLALGGFWRVLLWTSILALPWYLPNVVYFGNPIYPFYESIFGWASWGLMEADTIYKRDPGYLQEIQSAESTIWDSFTVLWRYTFKPNVEWVQDPVGRIGPFILALTPGIFFVKWNKAAKYMAIFIIMVYIYWFAYERVYNARMLLYVFALHILLGAWGIAGVIDRKSGGRVNWLQIVFSVVLVFFASVVTLGFVEKEVHFSPKDRSRYLVANKPGIRHINCINQEKPDNPVYIMGADETLHMLGADTKAYWLGTDKTVYMLGLDYYWFYCDFDIVGAPWGPANYVDFHNESGSAMQLSNWLKSLGCDLLLVNLGYLDPDGNPMGLDYTGVIEDPGWGIYFEQLLIPEDVMFPDMATRLYRIKE